MMTAAQESYAPLPKDLQARVRPEFGYLYPTVRAGEWESAAVLEDKILAQLVTAPSTSLVLRGRVLNREHFEYRQAERRGGRAVRS
jgi:hypothetical protein